MLGLYTSGDEPEQDLSKLSEGGTEGLVDQESKFICQLLLLLGLVMIGFYLVFFINQVASAVLNVLVSNSPGIHHVSNTYEAGWGTFGAILYETGTGFIYALAGACLSLIAVHIRNNASWNRLILPIKIFSCIVMTRAAVGILLLFTVNWKKASPYPPVDANLETLLLLMLQFAAFAAIFVLESPGVRARISRMIPRIIGEVGQ